METVSPEHIEVDIDTGTLTDEELRDGLTSQQAIVSDSRDPSGNDTIKRANIAKATVNLLLDEMLNRRA